jgi:hypothetical protein
MILEEQAKGEVMRIRISFRAYRLAPSMLLGGLTGGLPGMIMGGVGYGARKALTGQSNTPGQGLVNSAMKRHKRSRETKR